ncbi:RNA polymerase subunit sigma-70 [Sphingomonas sp. Leaf17]|uniref:FliA/WhiG family RNA polymerase sigma factor n=1 Tax=Sphingomonas sp. Leaf17 TaxID=1735683 RepID=UPI0006FFD82C|nr:FliA/WhiG family RNA polymerase sigma factor [Sphingomonas sp. Leaf17]KQM67441.1 RNA polymerase subunit sigma-70 [Sphingomonas sp. Leaf17]
MSALPMRSAFADATPLTYAPAPSAELLVRKHLPMVRRIAWHVHGSMSSVVEIEDLVQVGLVALVEAAAAAEDRGGHAFQLYLKTRLRGAMIDELRRQATTTRGAMRRRRALAEAVSALTVETGKAPGEASIAERLGVSVDKLRTEYATSEAIRFEPIDDVYTDDTPWFASDMPDAFEQLADGQQRDALIAAIASLPEREAMTIQLYYVEELNLEEIGQVLDVTAARVCQIKKSAHDRLRKALTGH